MGASLFLRWGGAWLGCLGLLVAPAQADRLQDIRSAGRIRVAIAGAVPPFNGYTPAGQARGSDFDTASLLARDLAVRLEIVRVSNADRVKVLLDKRADLVISALSITPEREREIAFSVPYARIATFIAAPATAPVSSMLDLNGRKVGVLANSSNLTHLLNAAPNARIVAYDDHDLLSAGYLAAEYDIVSATESAIAATNALRPAQALDIQFRQFEFDVAIGLSHGEKQLRDWVNAWVVSNLQNGRLNTIFRKHHGQGLPEGILPAQQPTRRP